MDSMPLRCQQESDQQQQHAAKAPKLLDDRQHQQPPASALALFVHEPCQGNSMLVTTATTSLATGGSVFSTGSPTATYPRPGSYFSLSQWRELELQALIYKYIVAGASVPLELILPIRGSLLNAAPHYSHYLPYPHLQLAMMPTGYWGRSTSDPEPGRCRRTDGKKWRCSREVVAGHKYCERHMHRGRNRSRKHVEVPTPIAGSSDMIKASSPPFSAAGPGEQGQSPSSLAGAGLQPPLDVLLLTRRRPDDDSNIKESFPQSCYRSFAAEEYGGRSRSGGQILRHFFDDWPSEQQQEADTHASNVGPPPASTTKLSISIPKQPPKSDFSLGLSTGNSEKRSACAEGVPGDAVAKQVRVSSWSGWVGQAATSMGGPLAEALRLSSSTPSPTSVLQKPNASASQTTSSIST